MVAGEQRPRLVELVFGRVMLELCGPQIAIGNPHREFGALKRLHGGCTALHERAGAIELGFGMIGLRLRPLGRRLGALQCGFGSAEPFLGLTPAARIEKGRRWRQDRSNDFIDGDMVAYLQPNAGQRPASGAATT